MRLSGESLANLKVPSVLGEPSHPHRTHHEACV